MTANLLKRISKITLLITLLVPSLLNNLYASPKVFKDAVLSQTTLMGTVFIDTNLNGYLDKGEAGIPGVRIATVSGLIMETDAYGRFHLPEEKIQNLHFGQNQLLKIDLHSLPQGALVTTENPRLLRTSNAGLNTINFGVAF